MNNGLILWGELALYIAAAVCLPYLALKGKNQATKEDIGNITTEIERVKTDFAHRLNINSFRYQKEFEILVELMEYLVTYRKCADSLITYINTADLSTPSDEYNIFLSRNVEAYDKFIQNAERYLPFYPPDIFKLIKEFDTAVKSTILNTIVAARSRPEDYEKYSQRIEAYGHDITKYSDAINDAIRGRVKTWELNMPEMN